MGEIKYNEILEVALAAKTQRVTVDTCVIQRRILLHSVIISSNGDGEADAVLRDGIDTTADILIDLYCQDEGQDGFTWNIPVVFEKGLFVDIGTNVKSVVVQYSVI